MIKHYDLPTLFAYKLRALWWRSEKVFHDRYAYKGRDFFDVIWYLQQWITPNFPIIQAYLQDHHGIKIDIMDDVFDALWRKIASLDADGIYDDIAWLIEDKQFSRDFADNFLQIYTWLIQEKKELRR